MRALKRSDRPEEEETNKLLLIGLGKSKIRVSENIIAKLIALLGNISSFKPSALFLQFKQKPGK